MLPVPGRLTGTIAAVREPISLQIRTWNIAHGRDVPPDAAYGHVRRKLLPEMAALMVDEEPDLILLQEVPVWAGKLLREQTGMGITLAPAYGAHIPFAHIPLPLAVGAWVGRAVPDLVRTQIEGQANALLYGPELLLVSARRVQLNVRERFRGEPRIAQLVRLRHRRSGREFAVANVHAGWEGNLTQLERAGYVLEQFARGAPMVLAGDLNARPRSPGMRTLVARGWHEDSDDMTVDHVLVKGAALDWPATRWKPERRNLSLNGGLPLRLSDHDPVDAVVAF
jgi:endonuclease/exonuclease/phosphatase family metal-dependent hydrolase